MSVSIKKRSRLQFGTLLSMDGFEFWDLLELPTIPAQPDDTTYQVLAGDRIDTLAFRFYGDPILWWVLAVANDLEFLPTDLQEGQTLRIPAARYILQVFFQKANNASR
jgi:nucleoid-associated protein YgaU